MRTPKRYAIGAAVTLALAGVLLGRLLPAPANDLPDDLQAVLTKEPVALPPLLRLVDHRGSIVTAEWFAGQWTVVAFGFTHCPDVCPATMAQFADVKRRFAQDHPALAPPRFVLVSVDPLRDTPPRLASFVRTFEPDFIGVTGEPGHIEALERQLHTFHRLGAPSATGHYDIAHGGHVFLIDPTGRWYARFAPPLDPAQVVRQLASIMEHYARAREVAKPESTS